MTRARLDPFRPVAQAIGMSRDGALVRLVPMSTDLAADLGAALAAIDPWARVALGPETMTRFLAATESGAVRYAIQLDDAVAGALVVRHPWLHGPYVQLIGLKPAFQGRGLGEVALRWLESEVKDRFRNVWLCVSAVNGDAQRFYERHGFMLAGRLDSLVFDGFDELLLRKRV